MAAECTSETFQYAPQLFGIKLAMATATSATNNDYVTFPQLQLVRGVVSNFATDGTAGTHTITGSTNVVTLTNGSTKTWKVLVWGE